MRLLNIAVLGIENRRGRAFLRLLEKSGLQIGLLRPLVEGSVGNRMISLRDADYAVDSASPLSFKGCDLVFLLGSREATMRFWEACVRAGCICIDGSGAFALSSMHRFLIPEINGEMITPQERVFVSPEPATTCLAHILYPLHKRIGLEEAVITYLQGAIGEEEQKELQYQYRQHLSGEKKEERRSISLVFNIIPSLGAPKGKGETAVERQISFQLKQLFAFPGFRCLVTAMQVPVLGASCFSIYLKARKSLELEELKEIFLSIPELTILDEPEKNLWATPATASRSETYEVSRLRTYPERNSLLFFLAVNEMGKGFGRNLVAMAEMFAKEAATLHVF